MIGCLVSLFRWGKGTKWFPHLLGMRRNNFSMFRGKVGLTVFRGKDGNTLWSYFLLRSSRASGDTWLLCFGGRGARVHLEWGGKHFTKFFPLLFSKCEWSHLIFMFMWKISSTVYRGEEGNTLWSCLLLCFPRASGDTQLLCLGGRWAQLCLWPKRETLYEVV